MKKTIKETRELMNKINEFLSEGEPWTSGENPQRIANDFMTAHADDLEQVLGHRWQTQGGAWANDSKKEQFVHDLIWQYCTENCPESMGDEEKSESLVQSVMGELP